MSAAQPDHRHVHVRVHARFEREIDALRQAGQLTKLGCAQRQTQLKRSGVLEDEVLAEMIFGYVSGRLDEKGAGHHDG